MSDRSEATWRAIRPDGRISNAAWSPDSEYDHAIRTLAEEALHDFQGDAMGYLWSAAPGMVRVSVDERRVFLVLSPEAAPSLPGQLLDMATGASGALLWLQPGVYESALRYHAEASWGVAWCRLQRVGE